MSAEARSLGVAEPGVPAFFPCAAPDPGPEQFRVETVATGLSAGTELTFVKGTNPHHTRTWNRDLRVFVDGEPTARYPVRVMGYMEVGRVTASRVDDVPPGALLAMAYGHRSAYTADASEFRYPLPSGIDPLLGTLVAQMGPIAANGLLHAAYDVAGPGLTGLGDGVAGRRVLVTGAGVVGLLTGALALTHGAAEVAVADPAPERLAAAGALGLRPLDERTRPAWEWCKTAWRDGADVAFQCRGRPAALVTALKALRPQGTVVDLAFYTDGAPELRLGEEFHHNGLAIRCAQIGRVPPGCSADWDRARLAAETVAFLESAGPALREHLVTDVVPFDDAPPFVADLAARRRRALLAVFVP
jgi:NADPH:quinone reductase-like Zn-dependent oxidoreductase